MSLTLSHVKTPAPTEATPIYYGILTDQGQALLANAIASGIPLPLTQMAVGDGAGQPVTPQPEMTELVNEVHRSPLNQLFVDPTASNEIVAEMVMGETIGGFWIRELGLYAGDILFAVANAPASYKPVLAEGAGRALLTRMILIVSDTSAVELILNPDTVMASRAYVDAKLAEHAASRDHPAAAEGAQGMIPIATPAMVAEGVDHTSAVTPAGAAATFAQLQHEHEIDDVLWLQEALDEKAELEHQHEMEEVSGLPEALNGKQPLDALLTALAALVTAVDYLPYFTGPDSVALTAFPGFARQLLAAATDASEVKRLLELTGINRTSPDWHSYSMNVTIPGGGEVVVPLPPNASDVLVRGVTRVTSTPTGFVGRFVNKSGGWEAESIFGNTGAFNHPTIGINSEGFPCFKNLHGNPYTFAYRYEVATQGSAVAYPFEFEKSLFHPYHLPEITEVEGLEQALNDKAAKVHAHTPDQAGAAPAVHGHAIADVSGLQSALDGKSPTGHTHTPDQAGAAPDGYGLGETSAPEYVGGVQVRNGFIKGFVDDGGGWPANGAGIQCGYNDNRRGQVFIGTDGTLHYRFSLSEEAVDLTTPWRTVVAKDELFATMFVAAVGTDRVLGVTYTNTQGMPLMLQIGMAAGGGVSGGTYIEVNGLCVATGYVSDSTADGGHMSVMVPAGATFRVTTNNGNILIGWIEVS